MEKRLNELVETPLSRAITSLTDHSSDGRGVVQDWRVIRALHLLLLLQATRLPDVQPPLESEEILRWDHTKIDQMVDTARKRYALVHLGAHPRGAPLLSLPRDVRHADSKAPGLLYSGDRDATHALPRRCGGPARCRPRSRCRATRSGQRGFSYKQLSWYFRTPGRHSPWHHRE